MKLNFLNKICRECSESKSVNEFQLKRINKDGTLNFYLDCKICRNKKKREEWHTKNRKLGRQKWSEKNREKDRAYKQKYRNKEDNKKRSLEIAKKRRKNDPNFKLRGNLRHRIWMALKGLVKYESTLELLGCSVEDFKKHLESKFQNGMSWENYGENGWHIDHIKPCASFDLSDIEQQKICFNYKNMQPLWAIDNLVKSDKII